MKGFKLSYFMQLTLALVLCAALVDQVRAEPTAIFVDGTTSITLDEGVTSGLEALGVTVGASDPGTIDDANVAVFPIVAGAIDLATSVGDISHAGGLSFTSADGATVVDLLNFVINNSSGNDSAGNDAAGNDGIVITGLAGLNGSLGGRIALFNMDFTDVIAVSTDTELTVNGVALTLTAAGANALNTAFGVDTFTEGLSIGTADVAAIAQTTDDTEGTGTSTDGTDGTDGGDAGTADDSDTSTDGATDDGATDDSGDDSADDTGDDAADDTGDDATDDAGDDAADDSTDA